MKPRANEDRKFRQYCCCIAQFSLVSSFYRQQKLRDVPKTVIKIQYQDTLLSMLKITR